MDLLVTDWQQHPQALSQVRTKVFIEEQQVPEELEWDEYDQQAMHVLVMDEGSPIACGRIKADGHIGRMAVLPTYRHQGIGTRVLNQLLEIARQQNLEAVYLHAQVTAIPFYERLGFHCCSDIFMDAGIPHRSMKRGL